MTTNDTQRHATFVGVRLKPRTNRIDETDDVG